MLLLKQSTPVNGHCCDFTETRYQDGNISKFIFLWDFFTISHPTTNRVLIIKFLFKCYLFEYGRHLRQSFGSVFFFLFVVDVPDVMRMRYVA